MKGEQELEMIKVGALAVLMMIVLVSVGANVITEIQKTQEKTQENQVNNETLAASLVNVSRDFANDRVDRILEVWNVTTRITGANFTINNRTGVSSLTFSDVVFNQTPLNVTYIYISDVYNVQYNVSGKGLTAMKTYGDWFTVIVTILLAVGLIMLILRYFGRFGSRTGV